jgi:hypothetical protein
LTLELVHLGTSARQMRIQTDPDEVGALQQLMLDAARRADDSWSRISEYETYAWPAAPRCSRVTSHRLPKLIFGSG